MIGRDPVRVNRGEVGIDWPVTVTVLRQKLGRAVVERSATQASTLMSQCWNNYGIRSMTATIGNVVFRRIVFPKRSCRSARTEA